MTFYDVSLFGSKIGGSSHGLWEVVNALKIVDKWFEVNPDLVRNIPGCQECNLTRPYQGDNALWHSLLVRECVAQEISKDATFQWTKKNGIGRQAPSDYLDQLVEAGEETWFTLEIDEL